MTSVAYSTGLDRSDCDSALHRERWAAFDAARTRWPGVQLPFQRFCQHLDSLGYELELPTDPGAIFLCLACGLGDATACGLLEALHFPTLRARVSRLYPCESSVDDILQIVLDKLIVGPSPRVHTYDGRGSLRGWLLRVATNVALDFRRAHTSRLRLRGPWLEVAGAVHSAHSVSPEERLIRDRCAPIVAAALSKAVRALPSQERTLLHHHFVSGLGIDTLGGLYSINRSTAARRILRNLALIRSEMRKELLHQLEPGELESCLPALYASLEISAGLLFAS